LKRRNNIYGFLLALVCGFANSVFVSIVAVKFLEKITYFFVLIDCSFSVIKFVYPVTAVLVGFSFVFAGYMERRWDDWKI